MAGASPHLRHLEALSVAPGAATALARYLDLLADWSSRTNLTGARTPADRVRVLVAPVVPAAGLVGRRLIDVGSGNGSPGLVLALLCPEAAATLLEPRARRWAFLREATRAAGRPDVVAVRARHDGYAGPPADTVTLRALTLPLPALAPLVAPGGAVLAFGDPPPPAAGWVEEAGAAGVRRFRRRP